MKYFFSIAFVLMVNIAVGQEYDFTVAKDGSGDFTSVQDAFDAVPDFRKSYTRIFVKNGDYKEKLVLASSKTNVQLIGEDMKLTVLTNDDYADKLNSFGEKMGTSGSSSFYIFGDGFRASNLTFENSSGPVGQAVAVRIDADQVVFEDCKFLGFQDTLYPYGKNKRQYYLRCYIEGTTDFIFGWSTAVFEQCKIFSKNGGSYITAASTLEETPFGFVFINSEFIGDAEDNSVYLGRPWRDYAQTVLLSCKLGKHIRPEGWHNWSKPNAEKTAFYAEYASEGAGANAEKRVDWSWQLTTEEADEYQLTNVFGGWNPNLIEITEP